MANKKFKFGAKNWKSDVGRTFYFYKTFPSAYYADRYATRISLLNVKSQYTVWCIFGEEKI